MTHHLLELNHVSHRYGDYSVVRDISLSLTRGTIGCLLGPSGCGKTTLLRGIAGFEPVSAGEIRINGSVVSRHGFTLLAEYCDEVVCLETPYDFRAVGQFYRDFPQVEDEEVIEILKLQNLAAN